MNRYIPEQLNKQAYKSYNIGDIKSAIENDEIIEGLVKKSYEDLTLEVELGPNIIGKLAFKDLEYSKDNKPVKSVAAISKVGRTIRFKVVSLDKSGDTYICQLSRKEAQRECYTNFVDKLKPGQVIDAIPTHIENYGIFCDIGNGITALLPLNNISITHLKNIKKDLSGIYKLKVVVKDITDGKITLTHKELLGTWEHEAAKFTPGETVTGVVREIKDYGIFVEITPNLVGLADNYPGIEEGDNVSIFIKSMSPEKMKVKLIITNKIESMSKKIHYNYVIPESGFLKDWVYSPENCNKKVETHF